MQDRSCCCCILKNEGGSCLACWCRCARACTHEWLKVRNWMPHSSLSLSQVNAVIGTLSAAAAIYWIQPWLYPLVIVVGGLITLVTNRNKDLTPKVRAVVYPQAAPGSNNKHCATQHDSQTVHAHVGHASSLTTGLYQNHRTLHPTTFLSCMCASLHMTSAVVWLVGVNIWY